MVGEEFWTNSIKKSDFIYTITITGFNFPPAKQTNETTPSHFDKQIAILLESQESYDRIICYTYSDSFQKFSGYNTTRHCPGFTTKQEGWKSYIYW
jgi:hypothetical protein